MKQKRTSGFTLIELMITVAILAIIAGIAYPAYQQYVVETRRATAQGDLLELAAFMERYYGQNFTYVGATLPFAKSPKQGSGATYYNYTVSNLTTTSYTLTATAVGTQASDTACKVMTLNQAGTRTPKDNCW